MKKIKEFIRNKKTGIIIGCITAFFVIAVLVNMGGNDTGKYDDTSFSTSGITDGITSELSTYGVNAPTTAGVQVQEKSFNSNSYESSGNSSYGSSENVGASTEQSKEPYMSAEVNFGDKIVYSGEVRIKSGDIPKTLEIIKKSIEENGGYITNLDTGSESYGNITARVPSENFDKLINDESIGKNNSVRRSVSSKDVSLEYSDELAELETLKIKEERILAYFKDAKDVETMLRLESELQKVRSDISASSKRLKMMDSYVSYSEINFYVNSRYSKPDEGAPFFERVKYTVEETVHFFKELSIGIVLTAIKLVPLAVYAGILFFVLRAIIRFCRKRKKNKNNTDKVD